MKLKKSDIEITKMTLTDFKQIENSLLQEFDDFWSPSVLKQELENTKNPNSYYIVAKLLNSSYICSPISDSKQINNNIVGFAGILNIFDEVNLMNIVVRKDFRHFGIGSHLLEAIIDYAKKQKSTSITLEVNEHNLSAIHLYKKYGFSQVGFRKKYYNNTDNAILMTLPLLFKKNKW